MTTADAIARLDAQIRKHKAEVRKHRKAAREAAEQRDRMIAFCRANGIPYREVPGAAQEGTANGRDDRT